MSILTVLKRNVILLLLYSLVIVIIIDSSYTQVFNFNNDEQAIRVNILTFSLIMAFYFAVQFTFIRYVQKKIRQNRYTENKWEIVSHKVVYIANYLLVAVASLIIVDMLITSSYSIYLLTSSVWISYILSMLSLSILISRLILWFRWNRSLIVLFYCASMVTLLANSCLVSVYVTDSISNVPRTIDQFRYPLADFNSGTGTLFDTSLNLSYIVSFFVTWMFTVLLLRHYSNKIGRRKYWIIVSIPLVFFIGQFQSLSIALLQGSILTDAVGFGSILSFIFNSANAVGGILFGLTFITISMNVRARAIKDYMIISAIGMTILFASNHSAIALGSGPYPPFSVGATWFVGISSYLLLVGIYSSALTVAKDTEIRRTIQKSVSGQFRLLHSIGSSEMEHQIKRNVVNITKRLTNENELEPQTSLEEDDVKDYVDEVLREISKRERAKDRMS
jgi:hypothetical protein